MNVWECDEPGCKCKAVGVGKAVGLMAIGWYVAEGRNFELKCPAHHPAQYIVESSVKIFQTQIREFVNEKFQPPIPIKEK